MAKTVEGGLAQGRTPPLHHNTELFANGFKIGKGSGVNAIKGRLHKPISRIRWLCCVGPMLLKQL
jgi:hypothetical protein